MKKLLHFLVITPLLHPRYILFDKHIIIEAFWLV